MTTSEPAQPTPLRDAAQDTALAVAPIGGIVTALVSFGLITELQGNAVLGLLGLLPGVITSVIAVYAARRTAVRAEPLVTPVASPRNDHGEHLVPQPPAELNIKPAPDPLGKKI